MCHLGGYGDVSLESRVAITSTTFNAAGQVTSISHSNGFTTSYSYSATRGWLTSVPSATSGTTIQCP